METKSPFLRSVCALSSGTIVAQVVGIVAAPVVSRVYRPEDFGLLGTFNAIAAVIGVMCTLKYEWAQVTAPNRSDADLLHRLGWVLSLAGALLVVVALVIWRADGRPLAGLYLLLPLVVFLTAQTNVETFRLNREERYRQLSVSRVSASLVGVPVRLGFGVLRFGAVGLGLADALSQLVGLLIIGKRPVTSCARDIWMAARKYRRFALFSAPAAVLNTISYHFEYVLFAAWFTLPQIGAYFLWNRLIAIPKQILAASIWQVFLKDAASLEHPEILERKWRRQGRFIALTALPYYSGAIILPFVMDFVFGRQWSAYVNLITPMLIGGHINLVVSSFSVFVILKRNRAELTFNAILSGVKILAVWGVASRLGDFQVTVWVLGLAQAVLFWLLGEWNYRMLGSRWGAFSRLYWQYGIWPMALPLAAMVGMTKLTHSPTILATWCLLVNGLFLWRSKGLHVPDERKRTTGLI